MNVHAKFFHTILFKIQLELKKAPPHTFERKIINSLQLQKATQFWPIANQT